MKRYKYFFIKDSSREAVGKVYASNKKKALEKSAGKKRLNINQFLEIFDIEQLNE
tara:strand:- start:40 stop:204 length:165 start_codon:yes stop_codon:yes gene_type:complete